MPCPLPAEEDIPIAYYGTSNIGQLKYVYRKGLALRYGKTMQCIAGIHYNFSLPEKLWPLLKQPWFCAVLALGFNTAAYSTRLFKGALDAIPAGEVEACRALGFSAGQTLWMKTRHAARRLVPAYSNEVILVLKGSSLASTITIMDIMGLAQGLNAQTYDTLAVFGVAGGLYLAMNGLLTIGFRWCEKRALAFQS